MKPREILQAMGLRSESLYSWSQPILKKLNVDNLQEAYEMAKDHIEVNIDQLPIKRDQTGKEEKDQSTASEIPFVSGVLMDVFPLLAQGATVTEVGEKVGLSACTVQARKKRILQLFHTKSIFEAAEQAKESGILKRRA